MSKNTQAEHGGEHIEQFRVRYGDLVDLTLLQLQDRARQQGLDNPWGMTVEELLEALGGHGSAHKGGGTTATIKPADFS